MLESLFHYTLILSSFGFILRVSSSIVLNINDEKQPLVCELSTENQQFSLPDAIWNSDYPQEIFFTSELDGRLITACPLKDTNPDIPEMLLENTNNETTCKHTLVPVITSSTMDYNPCDTSDEGSWLAAGYRVRTLTPFLNHNIHFGEIYHICYSESKGILFTLHTISNGNRGKPFKNEENKFRSNFKLNANQKGDQNNRNQYEIQFVPFDDMIPMPSKIATLLDFNFISTNMHVKIALDEFDKSVRSYTDKTLQSLQIISGIKNQSGTYDNDRIIWFWRLIKNGPFEMTCLFPNRKLKAEEIPCEIVPQMENFILYTTVIPGVICCKYLVMIEANSSQNKSE